MIKNVVRKILYDDFDITEYDGTTLFEFINYLKNKHKTEVFFDRDYHSYDDGYDIIIYIKSEETDDEYNKRIQREKALVDSIKNQEKAEYERLKKIFEKE